MSIITKIHGREMFWSGHLCEGDTIAPSDRTLLLWTRCGQHDVPANKATLIEEGDTVTCPECLADKEQQQ